MFSLPGQVNKITLQVTEYLLQAEDVHPISPRSTK
jgi:hypothetical protein